MIRKKKSGAYAFIFVDCILGVKNLVMGLFLNYIDNQGGGEGLPNNNDTNLKIPLSYKGSCNLSTKGGQNSQNPVIVIYE